MVHWLTLKKVCMIIELHLFYFQIPMIRVPQPVSRTPSVLATSFGGWKRIQVNKGSIQDREINLAITLVLISVLFVFCQSFKLIPDIYEVVRKFLFKYILKIFSLL